jgi:hypothetical protein
MVYSPPRPIYSGKFSSTVHPKSQMHRFYKAHEAISDQNEVMLELLYGANPITDAELSKLIERNPGRYGRFAGYLGKREEFARKYKAGKID